MVAIPFHVVYYSLYSPRNPEIFVSHAGLDAFAKENGVQREVPTPLPPSTHSSDANPLSPEELSQL